MWYLWSWRDLRRHSNAGHGLLNKPEITPPSHSYHCPDGTEQVGDEREQGRLLAAVLGGGRGEGRADLAVQRAARPQAAGAVEEGRHLRREASVAGAGSDHDGVVARQLFDRGDRGRLVELVAALAGHLLGHGFRDTLHRRLSSGGAGAFGDGLGHGLDMAVT